MLCQGKWVYAVSVEMGMILQRQKDMILFQGKEGSWENSEILCMSK